MSTKLPTPSKQTPVRSRTPSVSATMRPPSSMATSNTPSARRTAQSVAKPTATPPKSSSRRSDRASMTLGPTDKNRLNAMLEEAAAEESKPFVSYITDSLLQRLTGTQNLKEAKILRISESDSKVKVIENMDVVENLEELDLSDNEITKISGLAPLRRLKVLNLSTNQIVMIEGMDSLLRLDELDLSGNAIERIPATIKVLASLRTLKLHNNKLSTLRDLAHLRTLKNLISLTIFANPIADLEHSRGYTVYQLPGLTTLDDAPVDDEERQAAHARFDREEVESLEQQLAKAKQELKAAKDEISKTEKDHGSTRTAAGRLGKDVGQLTERIAKLEEENAAKSELLSKKSSELVGLCELLYEMKQELAFANIDKQFDTSVLDSILSGGDDPEPTPSTSSRPSDDVDSQLDRLDFDNMGSGMISPAIGSGVISPLPFTRSSIAQEFREMPYIGKTSATPKRHHNSSLPTSRVPNGSGYNSVHGSHSYRPQGTFGSSAEVQQAAYRFKTLQKQEDVLIAEQGVLDTTLAREQAALDKLRALIDEKTRAAEASDGPEGFTLLLEVEGLNEKLKAQEETVKELEHKKGELLTRLDPIRTEMDQMRSLIGNMDTETIDSAYDLSMEVKSLEAQIEDRDEQISKMQALLQKHGLLGELDRTVVLRKTENTTTTINTTTHSSQDILALLRAMELDHVQRVKRLIVDFPRFPTETPHWDAQPETVEEACHTLEQQITDAFGFGWSEEALTASVASLRTRIKQLSSQVEELEFLKYTNFFNIEDEPEEEAATAQSSAEKDNEQLFKLPVAVQAPQSDSDASSDASVTQSPSKTKSTEAIVRGAGVSYGVRREKLGKSLERQVWFLWRLLAGKMEQIRRAWNTGAISATDMQAMTASGEWKYWSGVGRLEFFFQHAMSHISVLEHQIAHLKGSAAAATYTASVGGPVSPELRSERESIAAEIEAITSELAMKKVNVESLRAEIQDLEHRMAQGAEQAAQLEALAKEMSQAKEQRDIANVELANLNSQIARCKATKEEVSSLQDQYNKLSSAITEANHARDELTAARREHANITVQIAGMQRVKEELEDMKRQLAEVKGEAYKAQLGKSSSTSISPAPTSNATKSRPAPLARAATVSTSTTTAYNSSDSIASSKTTTSSISSSRLLDPKSAESQEVPVSTSLTGSTTSISPSSSSSSLNSQTTDSAVGERLASLRQHEQVARQQYEQKEAAAQAKRTAPKRSWTVSESGGLARGAGPEYSRPTTPSSASTSTRVTPSPSLTQVSASSASTASTHTRAVSATPTKAAAMVASPSQSSVVEEHTINPAQDSDSGHAKLERKRSHIPKGLQAFLDESGLK